MKEKFKFLCCIAFILAALVACRKTYTVDTEGVTERIEADEKVLDSLVGTIRSVSVVSDCSDGAVMVSKVNTVFIFDVQPHYVIKEIVDSVGDEFFKLDVREVGNVKSGATERSLVMDSVFIDESGLLRIKVNTAGLGDDFLYCDGTEETEAQKVALSASLKIIGKNIEIGSRHFILQSIPDYFYFKFVDGTSVISMERVGNPDEISLTYSTDRVRWLPFIPGETKVKLAAPDDYVWFVSTFDGKTLGESRKNPPFSINADNYYRFKVDGGEAEVGGMIDFLLWNTLALDYNNDANAHKMASLFENCTNLSSACNLTVRIDPSEYMFFRMFAGCTSLKESPYVDADELRDRCYSQMFYGCSSLSELECHVTPSNSECFENWVSGVPADGVFVYDNGNGWTFGNSGIPATWSTRREARRK